MLAFSPWDMPQIEPIPRAKEDRSYQIEYEKWQSHETARLRRLDIQFKVSLFLGAVVFASICVGLFTFIEIIHAFEKLRVKA